MQWSDIPKHPSNKTLGQFAAAWLIFLSVAAALQYFRRGHHAVGMCLGVVAIVFGGLGLIKPQAVRWLFVGCMTVAFPIGWLVSQVMLLVMFYLIITPVAILFRLRGRDVLNRKPSPDRATYWQPKHTPQDVRSYFRQY